MLIFQNIYFVYKCIQITTILNDTVSICKNIELHIVYNCKLIVVYICSFIMIQERYFPPKLVEDQLNHWGNKLAISNIGSSVENRPIQCITLGEGDLKILLWSQMHGDESTTTRALLLLLPWLLAPEQKPLRDSLSVRVIPQLNPDGAFAYTRENANGIDLNRDAINLSQPESRCLKDCFDGFQPDYCFNLHDQRTIYGVDSFPVPATLSFLAPAADNTRKITPARSKAMKLIFDIAAHLTDDLPNGIGRFDDTYNPNCVGDTFSSLATPTLLFEAGHFQNDYARSKTVGFVLKALQKALQSIASQEYQSKRVEDYFSIPENSKSFYDLLLIGATIASEGKTTKNQFLVLQYEERLQNKKLFFLPRMVAFSSEKPIQKFHREIKLSDELKTEQIHFSINKIFKNPVFDKLLSVIS